MRTAYSEQGRLDCQGVLHVALNAECRDEIVPILRALQHVYSREQLREGVLELVAADVNPDSRDDRGRTGLDYWQIVVLASVRLGCNLNYDKLQDLAEQHRALRHIMGIGDWDQETSFNWRRIRDNICLLKPKTIEKISHLLVDEGHRLDEAAPKTVRADSFVVETNIHYPTESTLIRDGVRKIIELCVPLSAWLGLDGWRQHEHLLKKTKRYSRLIERIAARKGGKYQQRIKTAYQRLLRLSGKIVGRARCLCDQAEQRIGLSMDVYLRLDQLRTFLERTEHVRSTARRRVIHGESVPNSEKLFSIFEPHTQLYRRGKAGEPNQFGRLVMVYEDAAGFIVHHHVLPRDLNDRDVVVEQTQLVQHRLDGKIEQGSFDRGFHSPENQKSLQEVLRHPCLPKPGAKQSKQQAKNATIEFREARQRHPGVESAIGALQTGNSLDRCRDKTERGFERYIALGVLGRNLHVLGKLLIARDNPDCQAAATQRKTHPTRRKKRAA